MTLVAGLFAMLPSLLMGVGAVVIVAAKVTFDDPTPLSWSLSTALVALGTGRIVLALSFGKTANRALTYKQARVWERWFAVTSWLFAALAGTLIFVTLLQTELKPNHLLTDSMGCGVAAGATSRNASRPWIATWQIVLLLVPIILASLYRQESSYTVLAVLNFICLVANIDIVCRLHKQMVELLAAQHTLDRTRELEELNTALVIAKGEADAANLSKTRFLATASHDLLQPLNAARLYASALRERMDAASLLDANHNFAIKIDLSLEAVEHILTTLLDMSLIDAGALKPEFSTFTVHDLFQQLKLEFEPVARDKNIVLRFMPSSLSIRSDVRLLRRLLQNLITNAIKYTPNGRVTVGVRRLNEKARIEVCDTGIGIPTGHFGDIFQEFKRLPNAISSTASGAGLGLSIVERLCRILDHTIGVRSNLGRGSVFSVTLPKSADVPSAGTGVRQVIQRSLVGLVVVVIDNEPAILQGMFSLLETWNCTVVVGGTRDEVTTTLHDNDIVPDVILADYNLDHDDGIAVIMHLRDRHGSCPAVLITADRSQRLRDEAMEANIRVMSKPLKPAALRALLFQCRQESQ